MRSVSLLHAQLLTRFQPTLTSMASSRTLLSGPPAMPRPVGPSSARACLRQSSSAMQSVHTLARTPSTALSPLLWARSTRPTSQTSRTQNLPSRFHLSQAGQTRPRSSHSTRGVISSRRSSRRSWKNSGSTFVLETRSPPPRLETDECLLAVGLVLMI